MSINISGSGIVEANLADDAVTLAKMAGGTDGNLITYDASGDPAYVTTGTSGQVLTSGGAGVAPTFQAAASGGKVLQIVNFQTGAMISGSTILPYDDTIPQNTEGFEVMTLAITPTSATSKLRIEFLGCAQNNLNASITCAIFQDTAAGALAATGLQVPATSSTDSPSLTHTMTSGTTSATTFKLRMGSNTGTLTLNGYTASRRLGGVAASSLTITEYEV